MRYNAQLSPGLEFKQIRVRSHTRYAALVGLNNSTAIVYCYMNNKLSCRREAARCFVPLNISLSHSRSVETTPFN